MNVASIDLERGGGRPLVRGNQSARPLLVGSPALPAFASSRPARPVKDRLVRMAILLAAGDYCVACAAIFVGFLTRVAQRDEVPEFWANLTGSFTPAGFWVLGGGAVFSALLAIFRTYELGNLYRMNLLLRNILKSAVLSSLAVLALAGLMQYNHWAPRLGILYCAATLSAFAILARLGAFGLMMLPRVRRATRARLLVVGWNDRAENLRRAMLSDLGQHREIVGFVPACRRGMGGCPPQGVKLMGSYSDLPSLMKSEWIDGIILADMDVPADEIRRLVSFCQREYLSFHLIPEYFPALGSLLSTTAIKGVPLLGVGQLPLDSVFNRVLKRALDLAGASVGLILAAPIIGIFGLLVFLESPGPVIYRQKRTTRGGRTFTIYKIRSMRLDAETHSGAVWCSQDDPRRLRIGAFMRKTNIDELPQFWNVLRGDMSLVGPRPERPELIEGFKDEIPNYNVRHAARAGVTGWAAVNGFRGATDLRKRIEHDIYYVENWSLLLDLYCLVATFFKREGAH